MSYFGERLEIINTIREAAIKEMQSRELNTNQSPMYISVNDFNEVKTGNISIVTGGSVKYLFAFAGIGYTSQGFWKTTYEKILIMNKENETLEKIKLNNWSLDIFFNIFDRYGYNSPNSIISLNTDPTQTIEYSVGTFSQFQKAWDLFLEIENNCSTLESAKIYRDFYKERSEKDNINRKYQDLKIEFEKECDLNNRYKSLLQRIEEASIAKDNQIKV